MEKVDRELWRLGHRPALDGIRGLAILMVLVSHLDNPMTNPLVGSGQSGVTVFFTLSGFLITALLLGERDRTGCISFGAFYRRRARRLLPALFAVVLAVGVVQATWRSLQVDGGMVLSVLLYVSNWWTIHHSGYNGLAQMWSLGVEEQFYLLWPIVFAVAISRWGRKGVTYIAVIGLTLSVASVLGASTAIVIERGSVERASSLLIGCLLAVLVSSRPEERAPRWLAPLGFLMLAPAVWLRDITVIVLTVPLATAVILYAAVQGPGPRWLASSVLRWFGRRSYGLYVWHYPLLVALPLHALPWWGRSLTLLPFTLALGELSWWLIERPFQRRSRQPQTPEPSHGGAPEVIAAA